MRRIPERDCRHRCDPHMQEAYTDPHFCLTSYRIEHKNATHKTLALTARLLLAPALARFGLAKCSLSSYAPAGRIQVFTKIAIVFRQKKRRFLLGKLGVGLGRFLPLCALLLVLPSIAAAQCVSKLAVQRVWTQDSRGTDKTAFVPGDPIRFAAQLDNAYSAYMLAANGAQIAITTSFFSNSSRVDIPPGSSMRTWDSTVPSSQSSYPKIFGVKRHRASAYSNDCRLFPLAAILPQTSRDLLVVVTAASLSDQAGARKIFQQMRGTCKKLRKELAAGVTNRSKLL